MIALVMHDSEAPFTNLNEGLWNNVASAYGVPHVFKVGGKQERGFVQYGPEHTLPSRKVCLVTPAEAEGLDTIELKYYDHPEEAQYIFGPDDVLKGWHKKFDGASFVSITTPSSTQLHSFTVAAIVLYDRLKKIK